MSEERSNAPIIPVETAAPVAAAANAGKPSLWSQALRVVKGDSTAELIEQFTQEMTLVAEGLCEDQARLRRSVDGLIRQAENEHDRVQQTGEALARQLEVQSREVDRRLTEMSRRLDAIERAQAAKPAKKLLFSGDTLGRVTLLASIICGSGIIITLLQLFM